MPARRQARAFPGEDGGKAQGGAPRRSRLPRKGAPLRNAAGAPSPGPAAEPRGGSRHRRPGEAGRAGGGGGKAPFRAAGGGRPRPGRGVA